MKHGRYTTIEGGQEVSAKRVIVDVRTNGQLMKDWIVYPSNFSKVMVGLGLVCLVFPFALPIMLFVFLAFLDEYQKTAQYAPMRYPAWCKVPDPGLLHPGTDKPMQPTGIMYFGLIDARDPYERGKQVFLSADDLTRHMLVLGTTGSGKAQPLDAKVHTPSGWRTMGDIAVGDQVTTPAGGSAAVVAVFPQGELDIYRVTFADGRTTEACGDHLWEVHHKHWNGKYKPGVSRAGKAKPRTLTTKQVQELLQRNKGTFCVPLSEPVEKPRQELPLHPYLLGLLIGDGNMNKYLRISSADQDILDACAELLPAETELVQYESDGPYSYWIRSKPEHSFVGRHPDGSYARNPVKAILDGLALMGTTSETKFIPDIYREASIEQRKALLQGLMDTDGFANRDCANASYTTVSAILARQVQDLVRSLGGIASVSTKRPTYTHKGEKRTGRLAYTVNIRHPEPASLFRLGRKVDRVQSYQYSDTLKLKITQVEKIGRKVAKCIMLDDPRHLYITDDYVVTHNSEFLKGMTFNVLCWASGFFVADAKADNKLPTDMYSQVRMFARDYDYLVVNYLLGGLSPTQIASIRERLSNGLQPATAADADTLVQMTSNIMVKASGDSKTWQDRGLNLFRGICRALTHKRDLGELTLSIETMREYLALDKIEELYVEGWKQANGGAWPTPYLGVKSYLEVGLPGFQIQNMLRKHGCLKEEAEDEAAALNQAFGRPPAPTKKPPTNQTNETFNQHGYRADQVYPALSLLIDTYGHIFKRKHPEVDMQDVVVNNRICISLIPSLEKGAQEQESLGKLNLALLRVMMARALGSSIEGDVHQNVDAKITASDTPFALFLDEFAYQFAEGIALTAAQARSLNFFLCALAQDLEKLTEGDRAAEAGAMMANQATKFFMKIVGSDKTHELALKTLGEAEVAVVAGFETNTESLFGGVRRDINYKMEKRPRIGRKVLEELASGFATFAYRERAHVMRTFYPSPEVPRVRYPRINRFLQIHDLGETTMLTSTVELAPNADKWVMENIRGLLESGTAPAYPEQVTSDIIQSISSAAATMNPHTPAVERGIVLYQAGIQALHNARAGASLLGAAGSQRPPVNTAPPAAVASAVTDQAVAPPVPAAVVPASAGSAGMFGGGATDPAAQVAAELEAASSFAGDEFDSVSLSAELTAELAAESTSDKAGEDVASEESLIGFDPFDEVMRISPPIIRRPKEDVFGNEMGVSAPEEGEPPVVLAQDVIDGDQLEDDVQLDAGLVDLEDDIQLVMDTDPADEVLGEASGAIDQAIIATTPSSMAGDASTLSTQGSEQMRAGLEALSRTKVEAVLIERMGPEVIGLKDATKDELVGLEVTLGSTPEQAADAAQRTEKAVAKGLSLLDNNKTQTSSTDIEILFSELTNLVDSN
ncbi:LAGLIDADG family homing endonuclease [Massilia varians]|uniref:LAGLIDADG family homing endonuclease n=1 Tax=Massilia varians TaxID=457921 RepID=UPI002554F100|nr:LAGLIDADG family homing endonuclease [Massilia varians]MDK6076168.1 LAGLIDADG family homing endonuclease [Massilia varians]